MALAASQAGKRVLLVSTDPAHSTADMFERPIGPEPVQLLPNLHGLEIDGAFESKRYVANVKEHIQKLFGHQILKEAIKQIDLAASMPGAEEMALFDRIGALIRGEDDRFDLIVFDTAPTGHTLRLIRMPELMEAWIRALARLARGEADPLALLGALPMPSVRAASLTLSRAASATSPALSTSFLAVSAALSAASSTAAFALSAISLVSPSVPFLSVVMGSN